MKALKNAVALGLIVDDSGRITGGKVIGDAMSSLGGAAFNCVIWMDAPGADFRNSVRARMRTFPDQVEIDGRILPPH